MQQEQGWVSIIGQTMAIPKNFFLASVIVVNTAFQEYRRAKQAKRIIMKAKEEGPIDQQQRNDLLEYMEMCRSLNTVLCPIMVKEHKEGEQQPKHQLSLILKGDYTWSFAISVIREHLKIASEVSLTFFCGNCLIVNQMTIQETYRFHKKEDGVLYLRYLKLQAFG